MVDYEEIEDDLSDLDVENPAPKEPDPRVEEAKAAAKTFGHVLVDGSKYVVGVCIALAWMTSPIIITVMYNTGTEPTLGWFAFLIAGMIFTVGTAAAAITTYEEHYG